MTIAPLILYAAMAAAPAEGPDPVALVAKLASAEPAERTSASESLRALGRGALPALRDAMKAGDAAVRKRASTLWESIQRDLVNAPIDGSARRAGPDADRGRRGSHDADRALATIQRERPKEARGRP